jgi:hypothetical protein
MLHRPGSKKEPHFSVWFSWWTIRDLNLRAQVAADPASAADPLATLAQRAFGTGHKFEFKRCGKKETAPPKWNRSYCLIRTLKMPQS